MLQYQINKENKEIVIMALKKCKECNEQISKKATKCPKCGSPQKKPTSLFTWLVIVLVSVAFIGSMIKDSKLKDAQKSEYIAKTKKDNKNKVHFEANKETILSNVKSLYAEGDYKKVRQLAQKYALAKNKKLTTYDVNAEEHIILGELKIIPATSYTENLTKYKRLLKLNKASKKYQTKIAYYESKISREKQLSSAFSSWDGSHRALEAHVKSKMKNPDSYDHVKTTYIDKGDYLILSTTYRGTNSFNAIVTNTTRAKARISGGLIEIL